jgi:CRP-like cAMP-binding protein
MRSPQGASHGIAPGPGQRADFIPRDTVVNQLLLALDPDDFVIIAPRLTRVALKPRQVLVEPHIPIREAFFIENGAASVVSCTRHDRGLEVSMVGSMGLAGLPLTLGSVTSPFRCLMQIGGTALRIGADDLLRAIDDIPALRRILLSYTQVRLVQQAQIAVCNARHRLRQRVAGWMLMGLDRVPGGELPVTHDLLARLLGVRRAGVSAIIESFEREGIVRAGRGRLAVVDHAALTAAACDCHAVIRREHERLLGHHRRADRMPPGRADQPLTVAV